MAGVLESLCKSIARIEEYTRQAEFVDATLEQVKVRAERLEKFYERFIEAHQKLMERDSKKANTYDHVVAVVEANYFSAQSALSTKVNALTPILVSAPILQPPLAVQVNLPYQQHDMKNTWGDFDGTLTKWSGFRDRFMAAIHNNENVSPAFKFSYLKKSLVGKAARTLGEWQLTDDNYVEAWARLKQLYDRKYPICREHLRQLLRLPTIEGAPRPNDLQRMSNVTHEVLRQLRAQGIPVESWDMMVVHILHERLDPETSKQWELQRLTETPTVKQILEFLDRQAAALANVVDVHRTRTSDARSVSGNRRELSNSGRGNRSKVFSSDSDKKASQCIACEGDYALWSCDEFKALSLRARDELIRRYNLCRNCFKRGHGADNCYQGACVRCPGQMKHNSMLSRGMKPSEIIHSKLWIHGPPWLKYNSERWPDCVFVPNTVAEAESEFKTCVVAEVDEPLMITRRATKDRVSLIEYVDKLERAVNVVAYLLKFISNIKTHSVHKRKKRGEHISMSPTTEQRTKAMWFLLNQEQKKFYKKEIGCLEAGNSIPDKSRIESLKPELKDGLLRVHGRLKNASLDENMRHPVIIPDGSRLAWFIMDHAHRETKHGGVQVMMQFIRQKYWIPRLRGSLRSFIHKCMTCVRHNHGVEAQIMADLPADRVTAGKPFLHVGIDYAGPIDIKMIDREGNQIVGQKVWIAVFVYLKTRAVHLDLVTDLTTIAFIACYERFVSRRGRCERIYSDNGTAFVGAAKDIKRAMESWHKEDVFRHLSVKGTEWRFMTPAAPHQGGIYEAAVKSMKHHLVRVIGLRVLPFEQLRTLLAQVEAILNSRLLHPLSDDPEDFQALTPGHLLNGEPLVLPLPFAIPETSSSKGVQLWKERQRMVKTFWERWHNEYLTTLQERKKWRKSSERVQLRQLVLIKSENFPPAQWAMGRIIQLHPSEDNLVRSVTIQTATNKLRRPVQKICILPVELNEN